MSIKDGLLVHESPHETCAPGPILNVSTEYFGFELQAVVPIAFSGGALLGEADKLLPIFDQHLASVTAIASGRFIVELKGAPGKVVTMGAVGMGDYVWW